MKLLDDELWVLHRNVPENNYRDEIVYVLGATLHEVWNNVIEQEALGTGHTKNSLRRAGYRARRIGVILA